MKLITLLAGGDAAELNGIHFAFGVQLAIALLLLIVVGLFSFWWYRRSLAERPLHHRGKILALRLLTISLALFLVLNPAFVGQRFDPGQNYLLMLFDDSASMSIPNKGQESRGGQMVRAYSEASAAFEQKLRQRYQLAMYRFGDGIERIRDPRELNFTQPETNIGQAIQNAARDFEGIHLSGIVVFSDGNSQPDSLRDSMPQLPAKVPVITIGVGSREQWRDLAIDSVAYKRSREDRQAGTARVAFTASGMAGEKAAVELLAGDRVITSRTIEFSDDEERHDIKLEFEPGPQSANHRVRLRPSGFTAQPTQEAGKQPLGEDMVPQNNSREILVDHEEPIHKVFYFSGRPNWENKYIQRSLDEEKDFELTSVMRISPAETKFVFRGKRSTMVNPLFEGFYQDEPDQPRYDEAVFLRFGGDPSDAGKGFPELPAEIFRYDLVILSEIEARFFSEEHLELCRDFVRKRGGTLLVLGGPHAFSEGGYHGTAIEGMLPVLLQRKTAVDKANLTTRFRPLPTLEGQLSGLWALDANPQISRNLWSELPELTGINAFPMTRAGATTLAKAETDQTGPDDAPLFVMQRYGQGRTAVLATGSTWTWHMHTEKDDQRHGRFWRRLIRSLAQESMEPVVFRNKQDNYVSDAPIPIEIIVRDKLYDERSGLQTNLIATAPDGTVQTLPVEESLEESGLYKAEFTPDQTGVYQLKFTATDAQGETIGVLDEAVLAEPDQREFHNARFNPEALQMLAESTGGRYFGVDQLAEVPEHIPWVRNEASELVRLPIWHFPGFFIILMLSMGFEWYLRRTGGHA